MREAGAPPPRGLLGPDGAVIVFSEQNGAGSSSVMPWLTLGHLNSLAAEFSAKFVNEICPIGIAGEKDNE
jgi:hypothetical protein